MKAYPIGVIGAFGSPRQNISTRPLPRTVRKPRRRCEVNSLLTDAGGSELRSIRQVVPIDGDHSPPVGLQLNMITDSDAVGL